MQDQKVGAEEKLFFSALAASLEVAISLYESSSYSGAFLYDSSPAATDAQDSTNLTSSLLFPPALGLIREVTSFWI